MIRANTINTINNKKSKSYKMTTVNKRNNVNPLYKFNKM